MSNIRAKQLRPSTFDATVAGRAPFGAGLIDATLANSIIAASAIADAKLTSGADFLKRNGTVALTADLPAGGNKITGLGAGTAAGDAVNKGQLDAAIAGLDWKSSALAASTQDLTAETFGVTGVTYDNGAAGVGATLTQDDATDGAFGSLDGVAITLNARVLVKDQTAGLENGIYALTVVGDGAVTPWVLTRVMDSDEAVELEAASILVRQGTAHADSQWNQNADAVTVGTTALTWVQFGTQVAVTERQEAVASEVITGTDTALADTLDFVPVSNASVKLTLNGILLKQGAGFDYTISGQTITILASSGTAPDIDALDIFVAFYSS